MYITIHLIKEKINHRRWTAGKKIEKSFGLCRTGIEPSPLTH